MRGSTGQTIQVSDILVYANRVLTWKMGTLLDFSWSIYLYLVLRRSVLLKGQLIFGTHFVLAVFCQENVEISI